MVNIDNIEETLSEAEPGETVSLEIDGQLFYLEFQNQRDVIASGESNGIEWTTNPKARVYRGDMAFWVTDNDHDVSDLVDKLLEFGDFSSWSRIHNNIQTEVRVISGFEDKLHETAAHEHGVSRNVLLFKTSPLRDHDIGNEQ